MYKILLIEDDETILGELNKLFFASGFSVICGIEEMTGEFDLAVLDIGLPGLSGYEICAKIRETKSCPIIFLTSRDTPESEIKAFNVGGDDFVRKPFSPEVLIARVKRLLKYEQHETVTRGRMVLDTVKMEARNGDNKVGLSKTEFAILKIIAERRQLISQKEIIEKLWDNEAYVDENALYVNVNRLRKKLADIGLGDTVKTVRGGGYILGDVT